jgi:hypothetical protein
MIFSVSEKDNLQQRIIISAAYYLLAFISLLFVYLFTNIKISINKNDRFLLIFFIMLFFWSITLTNTPLIYSFKILVNFILGFLSIKLIYFYRERATKAIKFVLLINIIAIYFQQGFLLITGEYINLHAELFPFSRGDLEIIEFGKFYRFSGLHYEPGNYSIIVVLLLLLLNFLDKEKKSLFYFFAIFSIILTKSILGIFMAIILATIFFRKKMSTQFSFLQFSSSMVIIFSLIIFSGGKDYISSQFNNKDEFNSLQSKVTSFELFIERSSSEIFFGSGIHSNELISKSRIKGLVKDNGLAFNLTYSFGALGLFFLVFIFLKYKSKSKWEKLLVFSLISIFKIGFLYPAIFVFLFILMENNYTDNKQVYFINKG